MSDLNFLYGLVAGHLSDSAIKLWPSGAIDDAIRLALSICTALSPHRADTTVNVSVVGTGREIDVSLIPGLLLVKEVWLPYMAVDSEKSPNRRQFSFWVAPRSLRITDEPEPLDGEVARVFYETAHTIEGLDQETVTTFDDDELIVTGAVAYAVKNRVGELLRAGDSIKLAAALSDWSQSYLDNFMAGADRLGQERVP